MPRFEQADAAALAGLFRLESTRLDYVALFTARSADLFPWLAALTALTWCGLRWGRGRAALAGLAAALGAVALSQLLKVLLAHPRPQAVIEGDTLGPVALPSGHTTAAMAVAVMAVFCAPPDLRQWAVGLGALYAWAVGICLIILAWHLPSDVAAAMFLAAACGFACLPLPARLPAWLDRDRRSTPIPVLVAGWLLVTVGIAAFLVAVLAGSDRAGQALTYAHSHRSAIFAAVALAALAVILLAALARSASFRDDS